MNPLEKNEDDVLNAKPEAYWNLVSVSAAEREYTVFEERETSSY